MLPGQGYHSSGKRVPLWFWRTLYGAEVDLLVERGGKFIAIESKFAENPDHSSLKGVMALKEFYGDDFFDKGLIACRTPHPFPLAEDIKAIPGSLIHEYL